MARRRVRVPILATGVAVALVAAATSLEARQGGAPLPPTALPPAVAGNLVGLVWQADPSGPSVTAYRLFAGSGPGLSDVAILDVPANPTAFSASAPTGTYFVRIVAVNASGASLPSNEIVVLVTGGPPPCVLPGIPTGLRASASGNVVTVLWNGPSTGGVPLGYQLWVGSAPGAMNLGAFPIGNTTALTSPAPNGVYFLRILATNACGNSAPSAETSVTVGGGGGGLSIESSTCDDADLVSA
jgi:hypothetical protein